MGPEMVAPVVGWLCHESCSITGEMLISIAGRVAKMLLAETPGVYRRQWTIEEVGRTDRGDPQYKLARHIPARAERNHRTHSLQHRDGSV